MKPRKPKPKFREYVVPIHCTVCVRAASVRSALEKAEEACASISTAEGGDYNASEFNITAEVGGADEVEGY